jgi:redox-sensitive bicupin YhaK (pirin superfamily)
MIRVREKDARGYFDHGWLRTYHTFSFGNYFDPEHVQFRNLRVLNEDRVEPRQGFGTHPHQDMEILTLVLEGTLAHRDSMGNGSEIRPGEVQRMSAGTGVLHSERNPDGEPVHFYQIWILPDREGHEPGYEQKAFSRRSRSNRLRLVASPDGAEDSVSLNQDVRLYNALLEPGRAVVHEPAPGRHAWLQIARGAVELNGLPLRAGDGAAVSDVSRLEISGVESSEVLLFDLN